MTSTARSMILASATTVILCVLMLLPHLPGRYDASATTFSFVIQLGSHASLLLAPIGVAWLLSPRRSRRWYRLMLIAAGFIAVVLTVAAAMSQLTIGVIIVCAAIVFLRRLRLQASVHTQPMAGGRSAMPWVLVFLPLVLVTFRTTMVPRAAAWSRDRAIRHAAALIAEIEAYDHRQGHYPLSLQSLNRDFPTGVIGIDRFRYEPAGDAYQVFFIRPHVALDAQEVVLYNPHDEHRFTSHEVDILQYDGVELDRRRGDRRRTPLSQPHWISILFD